MSNNYVDINNFKMFEDGKKVFDKSKNFFVEEVTNCTWLLKKLFKVVHIQYNSSQKIMMIVRWKYLSCLLWNIFGYKWKVSNRGITISGKIKFLALSNTSFNLLETRPTQNPYEYDGRYEIEEELK